MIRKLFGTLFVLAIGAAAMWYALAHHIVTTDDGRVHVPKAALTFTDTLVDITAWTAEDFKANPKVTDALKDNGHGDLVKQTWQDAAKDVITDLITGEDDPEE